MPEKHCCACSNDLRPESNTHQIMCLAVTSKAQLPYFVVRSGHHSPEWPVFPRGHTSAIPGKCKVSTRGRPACVYTHYVEL